MHLQTGVAQARQLLSGVNGAFELVQHGSKVTAVTDQLLQRGYAWVTVHGQRPRLSRALQAEFRWMQIPTLVSARFQNASPCTALFFEPQIR